MAITLSNTFANALLGTSTTAGVAEQIGGGTLVIYGVGTGTPAGPNEALLSNAVLATFTLSAAGSQGAPSAGVMNLAFTALTVSVAATDTATFFRIKNSGGAALIQGSVGTSGADWNLSSVAFGSGDNVTITGTPTISWVTT